MAEEAVCGDGSPYDGRLGLRGAAIAIILSTSLVGTLLPIVVRRSKYACPEGVYAALKSLGSGIIIATAFIHLLAPAFESLGSDCLSGGTWGSYDFASAIAMSAVFGIFLIELVATRTGTKYLRKRGLRAHDPHRSRGKNEMGHTGHGTHVDPATRPAIPTASATGIEEVNGVAAPVGSLLGGETEGVKKVDLEAAATGHGHGHGHGHHHGDEDDVVSESAMAQIMGVAILEFGVIFHSFVIGLTLAVSEQLGPLLAVLTIHQTAEGLGLGTRLSGLPLPKKYRSVPYLAAVIYACTTPLGIAIGLGIRRTYNPDSAVALIVSGVLDATSAGILLWAGLVECLAHDFVFDKGMAESSDLYVAMCVGFTLLGAGVMALLGKWA